MLVQKYNDRVKIKNDQMRDRYHIKGWRVMNKAERLQRIFEILLAEGNASTKYLAEALGVSEITIRRDINNLCSDPNSPIKKVHGGVVYSLEKSGFEPMFDLKISHMADEKKKIARMALELVENGDTIFLDSGTTVYYFAKMLRSKRGLRIVTVDVRIAEELAEQPQIKTIVACGEVRPGYYSIGGAETVAFLETFRADKAFIAADAWNLEGVFNSSNFEVAVKRKMIELARSSYLLVDHTKFNKNAFIRVSDIDVFKAIITDQPLPSDISNELSKRGITVMF